MLEGKGKIKLTDLIDIDLLQKFQDIFAKSMGVASLTVDDDGPITKPSNFTDFCIKFTRGSKEGAHRCNKCDIKWGKVAAEKGQPVIYNCHVGLTDFAVPIMLSGRHIASILGGQVLTQKPDEEKFRSLANDLGINEDEYVKALKKINIVTKEHVENAANLLFLVAGSISQIALKNYELIRKNEIQNLYTEITETIRGSLDFQETFKLITEALVQKFNLERVSIVQITKKNDPRSFILMQEHKARKNIKSPYDYPDFEEALSWALSKILSDLKPIILDNIQDSDTPSFFRDMYRQIDAKSVCWFPIVLKDLLWGVIVLSKVDEYRTWSQDEVNLIKDVSVQAALAINQAKLYKEEKEALNRENLLRKIVAALRSTLDAEQIKKYFIEIIAGHFNADRCIFVDFDKDKNRFKSFQLEKLISAKDISLIGVDGEELFPEFSDRLRAGKNIVIKDVNKTLSRKTFENYKSLQNLKKSDAKSDYGLPVKYKNDLIGVIILHFIKEKRELSSEEFAFLKIIRDQAGIALHQAKLYEKLKRNIVNQSAILNNMPFMAWLKDKNSVLLAVNKVFAENCKTTIEDIVGKTDFDFFDKELAESYVKEDKIVMETKQTFSSNDIIVTPSGPKWHETYKSPVINENGEIIGTAGLSRDITELRDAEIKILNRQKELKKAHDREKFIRKIIESVRYSLDIREVKKRVTAELGKAFNADRCYFRQYDRVENRFLPPDVEYLSDNAIKSLTKEIPNQEALRYFIDEIGKTKKAFYPIYVNAENFKGSPLGDYLASSNIVADYAIPIINRQEELTWLVLHYTKEDPKLSEEDKKLLEIIAYQIDIAFEQIKLYNTAQKTANREKLIRKIIEVIRSSLDIEETLSIICEEAAYLFRVQRTAIAVFPDQSNFRDFTLRKEYVLESNMLSFQDVQSAPDVAEVWGRKLLNEDRIVAIDNISESDLPEFFKEAYAKVGVKSIMGVPLKKGDEIWGTLVLSEYNVLRHWSEDEKQMLKMIADQIFIAINQAELYEKEKQAAERERISRNIIEILRSSIDKVIIKKLFVKNIGKFFNADRVFFAEYNVDRKEYMPVDNDSEYLSESELQSVINYDWSNADIQNYIQPLLEKREIKIFDWNDYINQNNHFDDRFLELYLGSNVKSSYSFPVLYQERIIGFFCIEFMDKVTKLPDEDISRIRSICTQAGIALYHSELYKKAQECDFTKEEILSVFSSKIKEPTSRILETSMLLSENEFERQVQISYLQQIIESCNQLLELTRNS